jgi:8-amino-3,8-dideoxy-alpha-D-manno-octulosonate transaminase
MPGFELIGDEEFQEVREVFEKSKILFRHGFDPIRKGIFKVREFEEAFSRYLGVSDSLAVTSGTAALKVALKALGIGKGDEVITQSFTFVATVEAIIEVGAIPVICDIDDTLNLDPKSLENCITNKTKAVIAVHMLGTPARMEAISAITERSSIFLIEDTAWGCGGKLNGKFLGTIGNVGTYSFDFAKTMTTGEGGMIICKDPEILKKAKAYHDHGHENNPSLPRWEDSRSSSGFNYRMMELQGAVGIAQLKKLDYVISRQRENKNKIESIINSLPNIQSRTVPENSEETADALVFFTESNEIARACRDSLLKESLGTKILPEAITWHFAGTWNHMQELVERHPNLSAQFSVSRNFLNRAVALPINVLMHESIPEKVHVALKRVLV